jgi:RNA polymerase sigma-70 factor (ECF subfamily)
MSAKMNAQEFQTFYQEKFGLIYRYVYSKVGNREEAEDLTSEIFLKAVRSVDQQRSPQSRRNWLYRIASTTIADHWRTYYREPKASLDELLEAGWEGPAEDEPTAISNMEAYLVQRLLQALPEHYREVLTCRFLLDLSIRATALRMGLSTENVRVLQFRALKRAANLGRVVEE